MLRITKLTDYGVLLLTWLASRPGDECLNARDVAARTLLPAPTVGKLLGLLSREGILASQRGAGGGYRLARPAGEITVAEIVTALEGPIALTECLSGDSPTCGVDQICPTRANWDRINGAIRGALEGITLAEMAEPLHTQTAPEFRTVPSESPR